MSQEYRDYCNANYGPDDIPGPEPIRATVTLYVPDGYKDAAEFLKDCQFEGVAGAFDVVQELRDEAIFDPVRQKAADEIDRLRAELEQQRYENVKLYDDAKKRAIEHMTATDVFNELVRRLQWSGTEAEFDSISIGEIRRAI